MATVPMVASVQDMTLRPVASVGSVTELVGVIADLARDPNADVAKMERAIAMMKDVMAYQAKAEFDAAFAVMQGELPVIVRRKKADKSHYAPFEDIIEGVRPVLQKHGFSLRHTNHREGTEQVVTGILSHRAGHSERDEFRSAPDTSGSKNPIQAVASTRSYGQRYTTISLLGIATEDMDNDGKSHGQPQEPNGFESIMLDLELAADDGKFAASFKDARKDVREYAVKHCRAKLDEMTAKSLAVNTARAAESKKAAK